MWGKNNLNKIWKEKKKEKQHIIKLILQSYYKLASERLIT